MARVLEYTKTTIKKSLHEPRFLMSLFVSYLIDSSSGWWDTNRIDQLFLPFEAQKIRSITLWVTSKRTLWFGRNVKIGFIQ